MRPTVATRRSRGTRTALLILDMISEFEFPLGSLLVPPALRAAEHIRDMKRRAVSKRWPVIYVNDAPGPWESNPMEFIERCARPGARGRKIAELLAPTAKDHFLFKPRHSAFFDTPLNSVLSRLRVTRLILTGVTAHQCVLFTAMDAHVRGYQLAIPRRCVAAPKPSQTRYALTVLSDSLEAKIQ